MDQLQLESMEDSYNFMMEEYLIQKTVITKLIMLFLLLDMEKLMMEHHTGSSKTNGEKIGVIMDSLN